MDQGIVYGLETPAPPPPALSSHRSGSNDPIIARKQSRPFEERGHGYRRALFMGRLERPQFARDDYATCKRCLRNCRIGGGEEQRSRLNRMQPFGLQNFGGRGIGR